MKFIHELAEFNFFIVKQPSISLIILFCLKMMPHKMSRATGLWCRYILNVKCWERPGKGKNFLPLSSFGYMVAFCPFYYHVWFFLFFFFFCHNIFLQLTLSLSNRLTDAKNKLTVTKGDRWGKGEMDWGFGTGIYTLRYTEWLANGDLLCNTENSPQYSMIIYGKKNLKENGCVCMYNWIALLYSRNYHNIVDWLYFNKTF